MTKICMIKLHACCMKLEVRELAIKESICLLLTFGINSHLLRSTQKYNSNEQVFKLYMKEQGYKLCSKCVMRFVDAV